MGGSQSSPGKRKLDSIKDAIAIRDAAFNYNLFRRSEAYFEAVKICGRQITERELKNKFLQILRDYGYSKYITGSIVQGVYGMQPDRNIVFTGSKHCIACCAPFWNHMNNSGCEYYKFLITNKIKI